MDNITAEFALKKGDLWLSCELFSDIPKLARFYSKLREFGVSINFWVYDLFPMIHPEWSDDAEVVWFAKWWETVRAVADNIFCDSWKVQVEIERWMSTFPRSPDAPGSDPAVKWFHLGADGISNIEYKEKDGQDLKAKKAFELRRGARASFTSLASLHPRKGLDMLIDAFEILWDKGIDVDLVLTGRMYSVSSPLAKRINTHPRLSRNLFYAGYLSDRALEKLFSQCDGLIYPSFDEGFGLPVVEAMHAGVPVFLRDIPVMREAAGAGAAYWFADDGPESIADMVSAYLEKPPEARAPRVGEAGLLTWSQLTVHMLHSLGVAIRPS